MATRSAKEINEDLRRSLAKLLDLRARVSTIEKELTLAVVEILNLTKEMERDQAE